MKAHLSARAREVIKQIGDERLREAIQNRDQTLEVGKQTYSIQRSLITAPMPRVLPSRS